MRILDPFSGFYLLSHFLTHSCGPRPNMVNMTTIIDDKYDDEYDDKYNEEYDDNCDENYDDGRPEESGEVHQSGQSGSGWQ